MRLMCRPLEDGIGSLFGGKHCYLEVANANDVPRTTISAAPADPDNILTYFPGYDLNKGGQPTTFRLPTGMDDCQFFDCAFNAAFDIDDERHEYERPPFNGSDDELNNSNWFISEIFNRCGGSATFPSGAPGGASTGIFQ